MNDVCEAWDALEKAHEATQSAAAKLIELLEKEKAQAQANVDMWRDMK